MRVGNLNKFFVLVSRGRGRLNLLDHQLRIHQITALREISDELWINNKIIVRLALVKSMNRKNVRTILERSHKCRDVIRVVDRGIRLVSSIRSRIKGRTSWRIHLLNHHSIQVDDKSIVILHPQLKPLKGILIYHLEGNSQIERGIFRPHHPLHIRGNNSIIPRTQVITNRCQARIPSRVIKRLTAPNPSLPSRVITRNKKPRSAPSHDKRRRITRINFLLRQRNLPSFTHHLMLVNFISSSRKILRLITSNRLRHRLNIRMV